MIEIIDKVDCCGCNACGDICAQKAITFKTVSYTHLTLPTNSRV